MSDDDFDTTGRDGEPDATLLASAYVDGEATDDERALVETSPAVLDEARRLGDVRAVLSGTAPQASLSEREAHLAGALDVWARMPDVEHHGEATPAAGVDGAAAAALSTPRNESRKRGSRRGGERVGASQWFLSAAAALVVVAGGAAIARGILADTDDVDSSVAIEADEALPNGVPDNDSLEAAEIAGENVGADALLPAEQVEDEVARDGSSDTSSDAAESTGLFEADEESSGAPAAAEESEPSADDDGLAGAPPPGSEDELVVLMSPEELAQFASLALPAFDDAPLSTVDVDAEPPSNSCEFAFGVEVIAGFALYDGVVVTVGIDRDSDQALAYTDDRLGNCDLIDSVPLSAGTIAADS